MLYLERLNTGSKNKIVQKNIKAFVGVWKNCSKNSIFWPNFLEKLPKNLLPKFVSRAVYDFVKPFFPKTILLKFFYKYLQVEL